MTFQLRGISSSFSDPFVRKVSLLKKIKHRFVSTGKNIIIDVAIFSHDVTRRMRQNRLTLCRQQPQTSDFRNFRSQGNSSSGLYGRTSFISLPFSETRNHLVVCKRRQPQEAYYPLLIPNKWADPSCPAHKSNVHKRVALFVSCSLTVLKHTVVSYMRALGGVVRIINKRLPSMYIAVYIHLYTIIQTSLYK